ncbi:protein MpRLK-Pelle_L-LEC30 [Marchantia polymorpha subsp. ruderalis]|uniref:Protein kinase domain-containing protein n=2 Tax=Marchantia polymorpha TaxID=3197 RepID=A0AAF6B1K0_MARPO|nr:hypothetical protein MARPO_0004s0003 [Marchantia polymorpha]BBN05884.1 hypothetical protein Mp_3g16680 [Marchantia polymorpha subsp. ruderalis]|eukprot:PTQ48692.1 hypothetical protein MARPO_0004s0003 [Marchantia polymorpha]
MIRPAFFLLLFLVVLGTLEGTQSQDHALASFSIQEGACRCKKTRSTGNFLCSGNATTNAKGHLILIPDGGQVRNESYQNYFSTFGVALYEQPIQLLNSSSQEVVSFNASFSFQMEQGPKGAGDGMAFIMFSDKGMVGSAGSSLGIFDPYGSNVVETFAVEFDTYQNLDLDDINDNHVGVDLNGARSTKFISAPFDLASPMAARVRVYGWVDYDSSLELLEVRLDKSSKKPANPLLSHSFNFLTFFSNEEVWVGFSGSNGYCDCYSHYTIYDLNFSSWFPGPDVPSPPLLVTPPVPGPEPLIRRQNTTAMTTSRAPLSLVVIGGIAFGSVAIISATGFISWCVWARRRNRLRVQKASAASPSGTEESPMSGFSESLQIFTFKELELATKNFDDALILGEGGFGRVYRGQLPGSKQLVAVKKVSSHSKQGAREFQAEVRIISQLRHRNIVRLLGCCIQGPENFLLVYEFLPNGSLHDALFTQNPRLLSWAMRFNILQGLAASLDYLHEGWKKQVLHRDVKSSNVMLDDDFNAMLGDFGLARMVAHRQMPAAITAVVGTYGYIAPEAAMTGRFTPKTDVFAFGAVAVEIACGRKAFDERHPGGFLVNWVWSKMAADELLSCVDNRLVGKCDLQQVELVLHLGLLCSHPDAGERPTMHKVIEILSGTREMPSIPRSKRIPEYSPDAYTTRMHRFTPTAETPLNIPGLEPQGQISMFSSNTTSILGSRSYSTSGVDYSDSIDYADATYKS